MDTNLKRQENNLSYTNTFTKGMNTDLAYDFVPNNLYLFGKNIRIVNNSVLSEEPDSNNVNGVVAPVPAGKDVDFVFKDVKQPTEPGQSTQNLWTSDNVDRILAVKTVDNIGAIILKYTDGYWRVFKAEKTFDVDGKDVIELTYIYASTSTTEKDRFSIAINKETTDLTKLYIADGEHSIMIINLTEKDLSYYEGLTEDELSPNRIFPDTAPVIVDKITGTLLTSLVQYAYRLYKKFGTSSKMSPMTHKIQVVSNSRQTDIGNEEDTQSSIGFRLRIDIKQKLARLYDKIQLYRISYIKYGEEPKCELIWDAKFSKDIPADETTPIKFFVSDNGLKPLLEYTVDEFNQISGLTVVPQLIDYNQQYMFAADIKDESIIKIPETDLNTVAFSANNNNRIRLYSSQTYNEDEYKDFNSIDVAAAELDIYYINKYTDMSLGDTYYNLANEDKCMYIPKKQEEQDDTDTILGGKGPCVEWKFIVRQSPIHEDVYDEHFADPDLYTELSTAPTIGDITGGSDANKKIAASFLWGYAKETNDYNQYIIDVPRVSNKENIQYRLLKLNNGVIETTDFIQDNDKSYLELHLIEVLNRSNSFDDVITSSMFRSLQRGETYRYGIVFYDIYGNKTDVKWIADIRVPSTSLFAITEYNTESKTLYANTLGIQFKVNIGKDITSKYNLIKYEIVRCKKTPEYSRTLILVATSRPLSQKQFTNDVGPEETYYPYYASALLTTDPYQIGFKLARGQGRDFASASEVNNYHRGSDNKKHQLDFLQFFSPEILVRREDTLNLLTSSNISLHTEHFSHCGFELNDYDVIFRCKHQFWSKNLSGDVKFDSSEWPIVTEFKLGQEGIHSRCLEYGQCLYGPPGEVHSTTDDWEEYEIKNIKPKDENKVTNGLITLFDKTYNIKQVYMHPHSFIFRNPTDDGDEQKWYNIPQEWTYGYSKLWEFSKDYVYSVNSDIRLYKDTMFIDGFNKVRTYADDADLYDDLLGYWLLSAPYLVINGLLSTDTNCRLRMYTPFPVLNRAYIENEKDAKQRNCYVFKNYHTDRDQDYEMNKWLDIDYTNGYVVSPILDTDIATDIVEKNKYQVLHNKIIGINSIADVQNPLWEDGYDDVETSSSIVDTAVKKYKTFLTSVGNKTYCNWSACGLYNWRAGLNDTVARVTKSYNDDTGGDYNRIQHFFNPAAEDAKGYVPGGTDWGDDTSLGEANGATTDYWTAPSKDLRWNNGWFGPGPVCFLAELSDNLGQMDFEYGQFMSSGMSAPIKPKKAADYNELKKMYNKAAHAALYQPTKYTHAYFSSFGTWICNIIHNAINFEGITKEEKYYDHYLSFSNIANIDNDGEGKQIVFDGDIYILPCEFTSCFKTYNNNAPASTLNSQQFVYYIPMETKVNVCFDYGKNYRNTVNPNLQLEEGDMEGVVSQDRPLHLYNYIYSDNNNSIVEYIPSYEEDEMTHVEHRIIYSEPKTNGEDVDSWNTFKAANFIDADSHYGKITYLFTVKDIIHFWQTRAFGRLTVNERSLITDENQNQITLGTGGVVQRTDYISTNYGMKQYDMCAVNAESDVYWIDRTNNIFAVYSQGRVGSVGELCGVQNLINHRISNNYLPTIHYDINAKEVVAKCLEEDNTEQQIVYNTRVNVVTSIYTRDYDDIIEFNNILYGINIKANTATKYNFLSKDDVEDYLHPARISFLVNVAPDTTKVFDNQKIVTAKRKSYSASDDLEYTKNYMLNKQYTFTTDIHDTYWNQANKATEAITDREGNIIYNIPRYGENAKWGNRLNGKWMKVDLDMMLDYNDEHDYLLDDDKPISQVITKFRRSYV